MNDAIALLAISQLVCLGAIFYLYTQLQAVKARPRGKRATISPRVHLMSTTVEVGSHQAARAAQAAYAPARAAATTETTARGEAATLAARLTEMGVDVPSLARRLHKSEEEVRLLLRRQGVAR
jgi:hypothetical protein